MLKRQDYELRIAVTGACNLNCVYCNPGASVGEMSDDDLRRLLRAGALAGLHKIKWTGGEPTMRRNFVDIVSYASSIGFDQQSMTTNGLNMARMAQDLKNAGMQKVNISIDALNETKFKEITGVDGLHLVKKSVQVVADVFKYIGLNSVIIRENVADVANIVKLAQTVASDATVRVKFLEMLPNNNEFEIDKKKDKEQFVPASEIINLLGENGTLIGGRRDAGPDFKHITYQYSIAGKQGEYLIVPLRTENRECVKGACAKIRVNPHGKASPCNAAMHLVKDFAGLTQSETDVLMEQLIAGKENMDYTGLDDVRRNYDFWRFGRDKTK